MAKKKKQLITVNAAVISHIGNVRTNNEDNFFFDGQIMELSEVNDGCVVRTSQTEEFHLFAICDGMGGLEGGERAAYLGVSGMKELFKPIPEEKFEEIVTDYAMKTSESILADIASKGKNQKEGTTMALFYTYGRKGYIANIGDSRVYVVRQGRLTQLSEDHSVVYRKMLRGELTREQMRKHPQANAISHYMGIPKERIHDDFVHFRTVDLVNGDRYLLCTDGLTDLIPHERLEKLTRANNTPMHVARKLILEALELGGKDNITVIVADLSGAQLQMKAVTELTGLDTETDSNTETTEN